MPDPALSALRQMLAPMLLCCGMTLAAAAAIGQTVTGSSASPANITAQAADPGGARLASYYRQMEQGLLGQGHLRQDRNPRGARLDAETLAAHFMTIALQGEYDMRGGGLHGGAKDLPLRRWEVPVHLGVMFGASVHPAQRRADLASLRDTARRLETATGHPVALTANSPNFHVLIVSDAERAALDPILSEMMPGISRNARRAITGMGRNIFCMVIAMPDPRNRAEYIRAVAVIRAEHPPKMRQSCIEEELAQGMGLPNDHGAVWPSIFNDDAEFGVLTRHDELLLQMLYHPRLRPGMSAHEVARVLPDIAAQIATHR